MDLIREQIKNGRLQLPKIKNYEKVFGSELWLMANKMFQALWYHYLKKGDKSPTSTIYWIKEFGNVKAFNVLLKVLSDAGWITVVTHSHHNWSEMWLNESKLLEYVSKKTLDIVRKYNKYQQYTLDLYDTSFKPFDTYQNITRQGFAMASKVPFQFDRLVLHDYFDIVLEQINKGIEKTIEQYPSIVNDKANYRDVGTEILKTYIDYDGVYMSGQNRLDPRGRDIAGYLNKIGNPIGYKAMRAALKIPVNYRNTISRNGIKNKFLYLAELHGFREGTIQSKITFGRQQYYTKKTFRHVTEKNIGHHIAILLTYQDLDNAFQISQNKFKQLMFKLYNQANRKTCDKISMYAMYNAIEKTIDTKYKWIYPIEIDMSASVIGYLALLLGHKPYLERCNIIASNRLNDAWGHATIKNREQFKTIMRRLYGSTMSPIKIWQDMDIKYTTDEIQAFVNELYNGDLALAEGFKQFILTNCNTEQTMYLNVDNEIVKTKCNRFKYKGETTVKYDIYDTNSKSIRRIQHTDTVKIPDLIRFKRYMVTGLIHRLDGKVEDRTIKYVIDEYKWALPIHDATILCAEAADYCRDIYCNGKNEHEISLKYIFKHRHRILSDYFDSIGIPASAIVKWKKDIASKIEAVGKEFELNPMVLK